MFGLGRGKKKKDKIDGAAAASPPLPEASAKSGNRKAGAAGAGDDAVACDAAAPPAWMNSGVDYIGFEYDSPEAAAAAAAAASSRLAASREGGNRKRNKKKGGKNKEAVRPRVRDRAFGISSKERMHMAIFGLPGSGKSSIIKLLAYQNIVRGEGFMVIDPHGELARDVLSMIPPDRYGKTIYVNPASLYRFGRTVQINPLQCRTPDEKFVVVMSFVGTLYNLYKDSWGPRLETVLRNAANALVDSDEFNTLGNVSTMITDETARAEILKDVTSKTVRHFWEEIFAKQYSKDAGSAAYNKMDKILSTPTVAAMFDSQKSSIDMRAVIEDGMMLVVDLSTGASDDIAQFLGSIFLNALYVEAKRRIDVHAEDMEKARSNPFYVYIDEAHMFSNATMSEMLRALRKFGVKVCIATQTANAYEKDFANEIPGLCKTLVTGRCDFATAQMLKALMPVQVEEMQRLPNHTFALTSDEHGVSASGIVRARPVPFDGRKQGEWMEAARTSVEKWGRKLSVEKYMGVGRDDRLPFTPIECLILHLLHFDDRDWYREEILHRAKQVFPGIMENVVSGAIQRLTRERYAKTHKPVSDDGDDREGQMRYVLADKALNGYFSEAYGGRRAGSEVHMRVIFAAARMFRQYHCYARPDLGAGARKASEGGEPDLFVVEPDVLSDRHGNKKYDPLNWSKRSRIAVEVETDARKHMAHTVTNYTKTALGKGEKDGGGKDGNGGNDDGDAPPRGTDDMVQAYETEGKEEGHRVWFLCFDQDSHDKLLAAIQKKTGKENPPRLEMDVIDGPKVASKEHRLPREPPELLLSGLRVRTIAQLLPRDGAEAEMSEEAAEHYNRNDRVVAARVARDAKSAMGGRAGGGASGSGSGSGGSTGGSGGGGGRPKAAGPYKAATAYPDKEAPKNIARRKLAKPGSLYLTDLETDVYQAICKTYGVRANSIPAVRKLMGGSAETASDRDIGEALRELLIKKAIVLQRQTDTSRVGSVDGTGERKVNKQVRVYVPAVFTDEDGKAKAGGVDGGGGGKGGGGGGDGGEDGSAARAPEETEEDMQERIDCIMDPAVGKDNESENGDEDDGQEDGEGEGDEDATGGNVEEDDGVDDAGDGAGDGAGAGGDEDYDEDNDDDDDSGDPIEADVGGDEDDISSTSRTRVDPGIDLAQSSDSTLITMLSDAGMKDMHDSIRAELERRKGG